MIWRGNSLWPSEGGEADSDLALPNLGNSWWLLGGALGIMVIMLAATIGQMG